MCIQETKMSWIEITYLHLTHRRHTHTHTQILGKSTVCMGLLFVWTPYQVIQQLATMHLLLNAPQSSPRTEHT